MACVPELFVILMVVCVGHSSVIATCGPCDTTNGDCQGSTCFCKPGWFGPGCWTNCSAAGCMSPDACIAPDVCEVCTPACNHGECRAMGTATLGCYCYTGFTGVTCDEDVNECEDETNCVHGTCVNTYGSYTCTCNPGYNGLLCDTIDCGSSNEPCLNGGTCTETPTGQCYCAPGWTGDICDTIGCSAVDPCQNGGICAADVCQCTDEFTGNRCQTAACHPDDDPCQNGGNCTNKRCECTNDFAGDRCQSVACDTDAPCLNGGICVDKLCQCTVDFTGDRCQNGGTMLMPSLIVFLGTATVAPVLW